MIARIYPAPVEELWSLWATKEGFESWWGPEGFRAVVHTLEARRDGVLAYDLIAEAPDMIASLQALGRPAAHAARAQYTEFSPCERLAITSVIDFLPGVAAYENTVAVELLSAGQWTHMLVRLQPMHDEEYTRLSNQGFISQLRKLDARFGVG